MCCCSQPTINGQMGYRWQDHDSPGIRRIDPPMLENGEELLFDEPGRCGGLDAHCHHYRLVRWNAGIHLVVQHGGGRESFRLSTVPAWLKMLESLDTHARYWLFHSLYYAYRDGRTEATDETSQYYKRAFIEGRLKKRKRNHMIRCEVLSPVVGNGE